MLKSELVISGDLHLLRNYLEVYIKRFPMQSLSDKKKISREGYYELFYKLLQLFKTNPEEFRNKFVLRLLKDNKILTIIDSILIKENNWKVFNIDSMLFKNTKEQIIILIKMIENICLKTTVNQKMIFQYYFNSLQMIVYFNKIDSSISTIKRINELFHKNNVCCALKFVHPEEISFTITQQKMIIDFIEKMISSLFADHMEMITVEFDTGSPVLEILITILEELNIDLTTIVSELFSLIFKCSIVKAVGKYIEIIDILNKIKKIEIRKLTENQCKEILTNLLQYTKPLRNIMDVFINNKKCIIEEPDVSLSKEKEPDSTKKINTKKTGKGVVDGNKKKEKPGKRSGKNGLQEL